MSQIAQDNRATQQAAKTTTPSTQHQESTAISARHSNDKTSIETGPTREFELERHQKIAAALQTDVYHARKLGHEFEVGTKLRVLSDSSSVISIFSSGFSEVRSSDIDLAQRRFIPVDFAKSRVASVHPFAAVLTSNKDGSTNVEIRNLLLPSSPIVHTETIPTTEQSKLSGTAINSKMNAENTGDGFASIKLANIISNPDYIASHLDKIGLKLKPVLVREAKQLESKINNLNVEPHREKQAFIKTTTESPVSSKAREALLKLLEGGGTITINARPDGMDIPVRVHLNKKTVENDANVGVEINGEVEYIEITIPNDQYEEISPEDFIKQFSKYGTDKKLQNLESAFKTTTFKDDYENHVSKYPSLDGTSDVFMIQPSPKSDTASGDRWRVIQIGSKPKGVPNLSGIIRDIEPTQIGASGKIQILSLASNNELSKEQLANLGEFERGALDALDYFGIPNVISRIIITDTENANASYRKIDPNAIYITDEMLKHPGNIVSNVGWHEATHLVDSLCNDFLNSGKLEVVWNQHQSISSKNRSFLYDLDEKRFFQDGFGGHAEDNPAEFAASLLSSFRHPKWEKAVKEQTPEFQRSYQASLLALQHQLKITSQISKDAPIIADVATKLKQVEAIIEKHKTNPLSEDLLRQTINSLDWSSSSKFGNFTIPQELFPDQDIDPDLNELVLPKIPK